MKAEIVLQVPSKIYAFTLITKALCTNYGLSSYAVNTNDRIAYESVSKDDIYSILEYLTLNYYVYVDSETRNHVRTFIFYITEEDCFNESAI